MVRLAAASAGSPRTPTCDHGFVYHVTVTIEGINWQDFQELELLELPHEGDAIETRYGTCIVSKSDPSPDGDPHTGKVVCRFPGPPS